MSTFRSIWLRRLGIAAVLVALFSYLPYRVYRSSSLGRYFKLKAERDRLHAENLELYRTNQKLRAELSALLDSEDPSRLSQIAIERAARDELGLTRPGEIVFKIEGQL